MFCLEIVAHKTLAVNIFIFHYKTFFKINLFSQYTVKYNSSARKHFLFFLSFFWFGLFISLWVNYATIWMIKNFSNLIFENAN
jgi:hypothetical protein